MFPGIALAEAFLEETPGGEVSFVGTEAGLEARAVPARGFEIDFVPSGQIRGKGAGAVRGAARTIGGLWAAVSVLRRRRPDLVFGVGGYASVPVALAAAALRIPLFLQEQNAVPGRANRALSRLARRVYAGFSGARLHFPPGRAEVTGNPVRREIVEAARESRERPDPPGPFTVFALGGSQGARAINRLVVSMARRAKEGGRPIRFLLQTGETGAEEAERAVRQEDLPVETFRFTDRIASPFSRSHAVLMRAGALSVAEASLFGKPCVLVPYPFAADRHQEANAREFCAGGGGVWILQEEASPERVEAALLAWSEDPQRRKAAAEASARFGRPEAAREIVRKAIEEARCTARG